MINKLKFIVTIILLLCIVLFSGVYFAHANLSFSVPVSDEPWELWPVSMPNHSLEQITYINYAYEISNDKDFLYMLKAEMGDINPHGQSKVYSNGYREDSWGFCQFHRPSNPTIVNDPRFQDWRWQLDTCYSEWVNNQWKFNAYKRIQNDPNYRKIISNNFKFR